MHASSSECSHYYHRNMMAFISNMFVSMKHLIINLSMCLLPYEYRLAFNTIRMTNKYRQKLKVEMWLSAFMCSTTIAYTSKEKI